MASALGVFDSPIYHIIAPLVKRILQEVSNLLVLVQFQQGAQRTFTENKEYGIIYKNKNMRAWHKKLLPYLCTKHLIACWRECLGMYDIILNNRKGYRNHPATKEYKECPDKLWEYLQLVRKEMLKRGFNPKEMPTKCKKTENEPTQWQTLEEQIKRLKEKRKTIPSCKCKIEELDKLIK